MTAHHIGTSCHCEDCRREREALVAALDSFVAWAQGFTANLKDAALRYDGLRCINEGRAALAKARGDPA